MVSCWFYELLRLVATVFFLLMCISRCLLLQFPLSCRSNLIVELKAIQPCDFSWFCVVGLVKLDKDVYLFEIQIPLCMCTLFLILLWRVVHMVTVTFDELQYIRSMKLVIQDSNFSSNILGLKRAPTY
jgi:hypothetical protein